MDLVYGSGRKTSAFLEADMAKRVAYVVRNVTADGGTLDLTEGYRPVGVPSDQNARREQDTASGSSTQWFQWGRYQRYLQGDKSGTPSAAYPGTSRHGLGRAIDWNAPDAYSMTLRAKYMRLAGLVANVPSESWHAEPINSPLVDLDQKEDDFMSELSPIEQRHLFNSIDAMRKSSIHPGGYTYDAASLQILEQLRNESKQILKNQEDLSQRVAKLERKS